VKDQINIRTTAKILLFTLLALSQACVGKFLSTMLSNEGANFKLIEVTPVANTRIRVSYNKALDKTGNTGTVLSNYSIPGLNLVSVEAGSETNQVFLNLDPADSVRMDRQTYTLTVSNVLNQTLDPLLPEGSSMSFTGTRWLRAVCLNDDGTSSCPPLAATGGAVGYTIKVRGDYAVGANYQWRLLDAGTLAAVAACTNPRDTNYPTCNDNALPAYDNGQASGTTTLDWSTTTDVATAIKISGLATGNYRLVMKVQDTLGAWQPAGSETTYDFFVDSTPPANIGLSGAAGPTATPAYTSTTNVTVTNMNVRPRSCTEFPSPGAACSATPEAPSHYKYRVRYTAGACPGSGSFGAWSASEVSANIPITYIMASGDGCYNIQVLVRDIAGNWQCDAAKADADTTACPGGPGTGNITDFFNNKAYQMASFELDSTPPTASFISGTTPNNPTASTSLTAGVTSSSDVPYFRYRITGPGQAGVWSGDKVSGAGGVANPFITGNPPGEYISASGLTNGGTYVIDIIGKDAAGNYQSTSSPTSHTFTVDTSVPTALLTAYTGAGGCVGQQGLPNNPTNNNCFSLTVGGTGVTHYKATFVSGTACPNTDGAYSAATAVGTNYINLAPGFVNGTTYSICVRGGGSAVGPFGLSAGEITRHTFTYDNAPPTGTAVTQLLTPVYATAPASATIKTVLKDADVIIGNTSGEAVLAYKGAIYQTTDCTASPGLAAVQALTEKSVYTPIQKNSMANAEHRVCFIGRDAAGNYQTSLQEYSFTVFDPSTPSDGGGVDDSAYVSNFNFTWSGIPTDVTEIRIRVCTDSACASPIPGFQNGVAVCSSAATCAATTSYNVVSNCTGLGCIKPLNGSKYYAELKVTDASGNASGFGTVSNGKIITGGVTGIVRDTNGNPVSGATVTLYDNTCTGTSLGAATSSGAGAFTINSATPAYPPIVLATNGHCIKITASGGRQGTKQYINIDPATDTNVGSIYVVDPTGKGCIVGALVDGSTGSQLKLSNATFVLKDWNGTTISGAPALDPDGKQFVFPATCIANSATDWGASPYTSPTYTYASGLSAGVYSLKASVPNYYSFTEPTIGVTNNVAVHTGYLPMVGTFSSGSKNIKLILTWGTGAKDLDLHLVGPSNSGYDCQQYNSSNIDNSGVSKFHVYFQQKYCANTGTSAPYGSASMAVDDTYEYGPEIINIYDGFVDGAYKVSVYNNDPTAPDWTTSKARLYVYAGDFFSGGGGLIKTIDLHTSSTNRLWRPMKFSISGTTLTIDDNAGSTYGYTAATYAQMVGTSDGLGAISNLVVTAGGTGYTSAPTVTISAPAGTGSTATATATVAGNVVTGLTITSAGSGYTSTQAITVTLTGGGGSSATAAGIMTVTDPNTDPGLFTNGTTAAGGAGLADY
jgi:hypothetical protein